MDTITQTQDLAVEAANQINEMFGGVFFQDNVSDMAEIIRDLMRPTMEAGEAMAKALERAELSAKSHGAVYTAGRCGMAMAGWRAIHPAIRIAHQAGPMSGL